MKTIALLCGVCLVIVAFQKPLAPESVDHPAARKASGPPNRPASSEIYSPPQVIGQLTEPDINESSGIAASSVPHVYWTHNDSGDGPFIYAVDDRGKRQGVWRVAGATARDWEDIAAGPGPHGGKRYLYIGDIGDNGSKRPEVVVYRIPEPKIEPSDTVSTKANPRLTESADAIRLRYPDGSHDAEALLVHPYSGNLYIITKVALANPSVYEAMAPLTTGSKITLVRKAEINVPSLLGGIITGGSISPDGRRVALCDYLQGYEIVLPVRLTKFDEIWNEPLRPIDLGKRRQGEAITYRLDGMALIATSEGTPSPVIQVSRR